MLYMEHFLLEAIKFAAFVFVCGSLMRFRFQNKTTGLIAAGVLAGIVVLQAGLLAADLDETLVLTLLPSPHMFPPLLQSTSCRAPIFCRPCPYGAPVSW